MKGLRKMDNELSCLNIDAILHEDDSCSRINGDSIRGFMVEPSCRIEDIKEDTWSELYPSLEDNNGEYFALTGETSWGGTGFVALKSLKSNSFKWILHLSSMNNPSKIIIENTTVRVTTDLNHPDGLDFLIPIDKPEQFKIQTLSSNAAR